MTLGVDGNILVLLRQGMSTFRLLSFLLFPPDKEEEGEEENNADDDGNELEGCLQSPDILLI